MTVYGKAKIIANSGMKKKEVFNFFDKVQKDIVDYIVLFNEFDIPESKISEMYEEWQDS